MASARLKLLKDEKELTRRSDELARKRQELPWVRVDKEYRFETDEGSASLADLFRGRSQRLISELESAVTHILALLSLQFGRRTERTPALLESEF